MRWKITLSHPVEGSVTMSEPEGLISSIIGFERHTVFHSLVKFFRSSFRAYGTNGTQDGRRDFMKRVEALHGPNASIGIAIDYAYNNYTFQNFFTGEVPVGSFGEGLDVDHFLEFTPAQKSLWLKFINRVPSTVNIQSTLNLDGEAVSVPVSEVVKLPNQIINYKGEYRFTESFTFPSTSGSLLIQPDFDTVVIDEIKKRSPGNIIIDPELISGALYKGTAVPQFEAPWDGVYQFEIQLIYAEETDLGYWGSPPGACPFRIRKANEPIGPTNFTLEDFWYTDGTVQINRGQFIGSFRLKKGEQIYLIGNGSDGTFTIFGETIRSYKTDCDLATETAVILSGEQVIDGTLTSGSRVLVHMQGDKSENGIYITGAGAWTRAADCNTAAELNLAAVYITGGTIYSGYAFKQVNTIVTIDVDNVEWEAFQASYERTLPYPALAPTPVNYCKVTALTEYDETQADGFLLHDLMAAVCDRITSPGAFYSPYFGGLLTRARAYEANGDYWNNAAFKGVHARGYTLAQKLLSTSFKEIWEGIDPLFHLGAGYATLPSGEEVIEVAKREEFYDSSSMSVLFSYVQRISRKYNPELFYTEVTTGYADAKPEDINGLDDPQEQTRASILTNIGVPFKYLSTWIGTALSLEVTRRQGISRSSDYKFDDKMFIVNVKQDGDNYTPILNDGFVSTTGIDNPDSRYNKALTPARALLRWSKTIFSGLQSYIGTVLAFTGGKGNYEMATQMSPSARDDNYGGAILSEGADIPVTNEHLYYPVPYTIEHYMTLEEFNAIDANKKIAVGISQDGANHKPFFIDLLEYETLSGQLKMTGKFKEPFDIKTVPPGGTIVQNGRVFDATFEIKFE